MRIVFIGAGNVASHLSVVLQRSGHQIVQVYNRTRHNGVELSEQLGDTHYISNLSNIVTDADLYFFCLKDNALDNILRDFPQTSGLWIHTAGSIDINIFKGRHADYAVIYPLQTFSKGRNVDFSDIPLFLEASSKESATIIEKLSRSISSDVQFLSSDKRLYLHLAAVFACNFVNHMYWTASDILKNRDIDFSKLRPLILETARKVMSMSPKETQTGPAVRNDSEVIQNHLKLLENEDLKDLYLRLSKRIYHQQGG